MRRNPRRISLGGVLPLLVLVLLGTGAWASGTVELTVFRPEAFFRNAGAPGPVMRSFSVPATQGTFLLRLENGNPEGGNLVSSAVIKVNGLTVVKTSDLSQQVRRLEVPLPHLTRGQNTLSVEVRSIPSSYVTVTVLGTYLLDVTMSTPAQGATVDGDRVDVEGTWVAYTNDVGITVNGVPAAIVGQSFAAAGVRLGPGANALEAVVTTVEGITDGHAVSVTSSGAPPPLLSLRPNRSSGAAPLEVVFQATARGLEPVEYRYDFDGDGAVDETQTDEAPVSFFYPAPGLYRASVTAVSPSGETSTATAQIAIQDRAAVDQVLLPRWAAVSSALQAQNVSGSLAHFLPSSREKYQVVFTSLADRLPAVFGALPVPELVSLRNHVAQYRVTREQVWDGTPQTITYFLWFVQDEHGLWKIDAF